METKTTTTANEIQLKSVFLNNKLWANSGKNANYNNHKITVKTNKGKITFDFWSSIANPEITNDNELIFAFYCFLSDSFAAEQTYFDFCSEFGYDTNTESKKIYNSCVRSKNKFDKIF